MRAVPIQNIVVLKFSHLPFYCFEDYFCSLDIKENKIKIELFNYNNGMGEDITYEYSINNNMI